MTNARELVDNFVALLRQIPELVAEMDGDSSRIRAYHDSFPEASSLESAVHTMQAPGILVAWMGEEPGSIGELQAYRQRLRVCIRARNYYKVCGLLRHGVPTSIGVPMIRATVHPSCLPMDLPRIERRTDAEQLDYFEAEIGFLEYGDE